MKLIIHLLMKTTLPFLQRRSSKIFLLLFLFISVQAYSQNEAPVLSGIEVLDLSYTENGDPIDITDSIVITDSDDTKLESATVQITDGLSERGGCPFLYKHRENRRFLGCRTTVR